MNTLSGALFGAVPGLVLLAVGLIVTGGGDAMFFFGPWGVTLTLVGFIAGGVWGSRTDGWLSDHSVLGLIVGLVTVVLLGGLLVAVGSGPPDADDCGELYGMHGVIGEDGRLDEEPPELSDEEIESIRAEIVELEADASEHQEEDREDQLAACARLTAELDARSGN